MARPDFPRTFPEFVTRFHDDASCWNYLVQSRWPDGFVCPEDGGPGTFIKTRKLFQCRSGHQVSVTSGTVMHRTKIPICKWFWGAYMITTHTPGVSALQFARQLDLPYETAYMMLQKLRAGMVDPARVPLRGLVEVDETYIGGTRRGKGGRGASNKVIVVAAVEVVQKRAGRLRLRLVPNATAHSLMGFIRDFVESGATIRTDGWAGYNGVVDAGYDHEIVSDPRQLPHIHRVFSNLKTWMLGTHHGVSKKHMQAYLNEFVFRFNRRFTPMAAFQRVLGIGSSVAGPTYDDIYGGGWVHPNPDTAPTR
jgi:transposase-like protein